MAATRQMIRTISAMGERESLHRPLREVLVAAVAAGVMAHTSLGVAADPSAHHNLNPGVRPGDVVIIRRVEPAPIGSVDRHAGPIPSRVNVRDGGMDIQRQLVGGGIVALSDDRAAGVRSSVQSSVGRALNPGSSALMRNGGQGGSASSNRVAGSLGGGSGVGSGIAGSVTSATSGIAGTVGNALSPFTGRK